VSEKNREAAIRKWAASAPQRANRKRLLADLKLLARVIRHESATIRFRERNRRRALAQYHERGYKRHLRAGLLSAARRMFTLKPIESVRRLTAAVDSVLERRRRKEAKQIRRKLVRTLRRRLENSMLRLKAGVSKSKTARDLLGCDLDFLRVHLEKQFRPGMTWENHGYHGWHVDHKKALASFNLSDPEQVANAFHYSNLQPLWARENIEKGKN